MKKKNKKYLITFIIWLATMIIANSLNEHYNVSPTFRGLTVGLWASAAYLLFRDLIRPKGMKINEEEEEEEEEKK